jgi:hypothetical protein
MKTQVSTAAVALAVLAALPTAAHAAPAPEAGAAQKGVPRIQQMVVFGGGGAVAKRVLAKRTTARVGGRRCAIAAATPLAALLAADPGRIVFHDYGSCSRRPADAASLFVKALRGARNRGQDGWVYKVGRRLATAGAADPAGPFGNGRLRAGDDVVWFYCRQFANGTCQRTLEVATRTEGRRLTVAVRGYDDAGDGVTVAGATVRAGTRRATTDGDGRATLTLPRGVHRVHAAKRGAIRSFAKRVRIG